MKTKACALLGTLLFLLPNVSSAFLGSSESSLEVAKTFIAPSSENVTQHQYHTVHEYSVRRGTIRAYASPTVGVFAYTGHNQMGHPPLALFGQYQSEYQEALKQSRKGHGHARKPLSIVTAHIRASISGPQGALNWRISLKDLPTGVTADDIR